MVNFPTSLDDNVSLFLAGNNLRTTLTSTIDSSTLTIPVVTTTGYPSTGFVSILTGTDITATEAIQYISTTPTQFNASVRGADGTIAVVHDAGNNVDFTIVAAHHNELKNAVIVLENFVGVSGSENFLPQDESGNIVVSGTGTFTTSLTVSGIPVITEADDLFVNQTGDTMSGDLDMDGNVVRNAGVVVIQPEEPAITVSGLLWFDTDESDVIASLPGGITNASGTFTQSLTISGVPVGTASTLQDAYDNGTGVITTTPLKPITISGTEADGNVDFRVVGSGTFTEALTIGGGTTYITGNTILSDQADFQNIICSGVQVATLNTVRFDRQMGHAASGSVTTSTSYVDLATMVLTSKDFGQTGCYIVNFSCRADNSSNNKTNSFQLVVGGAAEVDSEVFYSYSPGEEFSATMYHLLPTVTGGTEIKIQYKTTGGTLTAGHRTLIIDGVPGSQVVT